MLSYYINDNLPSLAKGRYHSQVVMPSIPRALMPRVQTQPATNRKKNFCSYCGPDVRLSQCPGSFFCFLTTQRQAVAFQGKATIWETSPAHMSWSSAHHQSPLRVDETGPLKSKGRKTGLVDPWGVVFALALLRSNLSSSCRILQSATGPARLIF